MITWVRTYVYRSGEVGGTIAHAVLWSEVRRVLWSLPGSIGLAVAGVAVLYLLARSRRSR